MKFTHYLIYLTVALLFMSRYVSTAQDDPFSSEESENEQAQIRIYTESYEISALEYAKIMTIASDNNNHGELRNTLLAKAKAKLGEAVLLSNHSITCRSGERATIESVRENIYPIELPTLDDDYFKKMLQDGGNIFPSNPATPTAFQTRNSGNSFQVEPILDESLKHVDVSLDIETVKYVGEHVVSTMDKSYVTSKESRPIFYKRQVKTAVSLVDGEFLIVNTFSPELEGEIDHSRKILCFFRAEILGFEK